MLRDILILEKGLSRRESEVAELVSRGLRNKDVANALFITEKTVKFHLTKIYKKIAIRSRAQLILWCAPKMTFEEKNAPLANDRAAVAALEITFPVGINRAGNA